MPSETDSSQREPLQFQRAEYEKPPDETNRCVACKSPIGGQYYHAAGQVVCPDCATRIQQGQQAPPASSFGRAFLYGGAAALAGCIIYAAVAIFLHIETAIIAILIGYMVGKAIRKASNGLGGRPQQILAVVLTYFAITTSYVPVVIYQWSQKAPEKTVTTERPTERPSPAQAIATLLVLAAAAPFLSLSQGLSGIITIVIIFVGLSQAWRLTGRTDVLIMGPYETPGAAA